MVIFPLRGRLLHFLFLFSFLFFGARVSFEFQRERIKEKEKNYVPFFRRFILHHLINSVSRVVHSDAFTPYLITDNCSLRASPSIIKQSVSPEFRGSRFEIGRCTRASVFVCVSVVSRLWLNNLAARARNARCVHFHDAWHRN